MTTEELARILREIEIKEFMADDDEDIEEYFTYDELDDNMKKVYIRFAEAYQKYFDMERKDGTSSAGFSKQLNAN